MKYCVKCGHEMFDEAVLCVKCGYSPYQISNQKNAPTNTVKAPTSASAQKKTSNKPSLLFLNLVNVFNFVTAFFSILAGFFLSLSILFAHHYINYYGYGNYRVYSYPEYGFVVFAIVISSIAVACGITSFIFSLINKTNKMTKIFSALSILILALALFILSIMFICC